MERVYYAQRDGEEQTALQIPWVFVEFQNHIRNGDKRYPKANHSRQQNLWTNSSHNVTSTQI